MFSDRIINYVTYPVGLVAKVAMEKPYDGKETQEYQSLVKECQEALQTWRAECLERKLNRLKQKLLAKWKPSQGKDLEN